MAENTLGRRLQNREEEIKIHGMWFKRKAHVENINAFSAHADYEEAGQWMEKLDLSRLKKIFIVHGEKKAQVPFKKYLEEKFDAEPVIVKYGENYILD
jgi:metallo-beta-lactamase family protein